MLHVCSSSPLPSFAVQFFNSVNHPSWKCFAFRVLFKDTWERIASTFGGMNYIFILVSGDSRSLARLSSVHGNCDGDCLLLFEDLLSPRPLAGCRASVKINKTSLLLVLSYRGIRSSQQPSEIVRTRVIIFILYLEIISQREIKQYSRRHTNS